LRYVTEVEPCPEANSLKAEYDAWQEALPDSLRDTATGAALQAIVDLDLDVPQWRARPEDHGPHTRHRSLTTMRG
jgi:hypothetical protein